MGTDRQFAQFCAVLEVPELSVDSIGLTVSDLRATLALDANAANLVAISAGADVSIERVELEIVGVVRRGISSSLAKELPVPIGKGAIIVCEPARPLATSPNVPSPPAANTIWWLAAAASRASSTAWPA